MFVNIVSVLVILFLCAVLVVWLQHEHEKNLANKAKQVEPLLTTNVTAEMALYTPLKQGTYKLMSTTDITLYLNQLELVHAQLQQEEANAKREIWEYCKENLNGSEHLYNELLKFEYVHGTSTNETYLAIEKRMTAAQHAQLMIKHAIENITERLEGIQ